MQLILLQTQLRSVPDCAQLKPQIYIFFLTTLSIEWRDSVDSLGVFVFLAKEKPARNLFKQ